MMDLIPLQELSVVEYLNNSEASRCPYCKSGHTYFSRGMWAHALAVKDYQNLIDRDWPRSGQYCYKQTMPKTCCPMYTIRCDVGHIRLSKSQKKTLKKFSNYLRSGNPHRNVDSDEAGCGSLSEGESPSIAARAEGQNAAPSVVELKKMCMGTPTTQKGQSSLGNPGACTLSLTKDDPEPMVVDDGTKNPGVSGASGDVKKAPYHPIVRKARVIRQENKYKKLISRGMDEEEAARKAYHSKKTKPRVEEVPLEEYFPSKGETTDFAHKLEVRLVPVSEVLRDSAVLDESFNLFKRYQTVIHHDDPEECTMSQYKEFLLSSPLPLTHNSTSPPCGFGSFHHQYWLDGKLKAVGVIDILTKCISSLYFFYDPDLRYLSFGTYGSLNEICLARSLTRVCPSIKYYYLGYYIHSCPKMSYKAKYNPSYLLCPEVYTWHRIEKCLPKFDASNYSRLEEDPTIVDKHGEVNLSEVMVCYKSTRYTYEAYVEINPHASDKDQVEEYAQLVGSECYQCLLLYRP